MIDMPWNEAIIKVLKESDSAMRYTDIAEKVVEDKLRESVGATPAATVNAYITSSIKKDATNSPFIKVGKGEYFLREKIDIPEVIDGETNENLTKEDTEEKSHNSIIQAFGMFWQRNMINWTRSPNLLGKQQIGADSVNFSNQLGVYLLYDGRDVIYVGRSVERPLGLRLFEHTQDRLKGRWDRFSWFGLHQVTEKGELKEVNIAPTIDIIISTLEALLIEGLEPPQNRKRGDDFNAIEYLQAEDPEIEKQQMRSLLAEMQIKLSK